jgi:nitroreductase
MKERAEDFLAMVRTRRTVRDFAPDPVPMDVVERCIEAAGTAPNGANRQPWHFAVITDPGVKRRIREAAEKEERAFYGGRAPQDWLDALAHLGTDEHKPFLETAPVLIAVFAESYALDDDGERMKNYYVAESVGIATGILVTALHASGLATLTHTPSPMGFLNEIVQRPRNERPFLLLVVGRPAPGARVPVISKKPLSEITSHH